MNSKIDVRIESVRFAVTVEGVTPENVISVAKEIETYILGDATLPELYDPNSYLKQVSELLSHNSSFKPTTDEKGFKETKIEENVVE